MQTPQFKKGRVETFNEKKIPLYMLRQTDIRSLVGLYVSEAVLYLGLSLIVLNNFDVLAPGTYFGKSSWVSMTVFSLGLVINFISIPSLYFSSFKNFVKEDDFWDRETFWILPLFFFGTFFLYGSHVNYAFFLLTLSVAVIASVHLKFILESKKFLLSSSEEALMRRRQYFHSLKYLTVYYVMLLMLLILFNPLQHLLGWIRMTS